MLIKTIVNVVLIYGNKVKNGVPIRTVKFLGYLQRLSGLTPWKEPRWAPEPVWAVLEERNSIVLLGFGPRNVQPIASCYTDCTFPAPSSVTKDLICSCEAMARQRYNAFGRPTVEPKDIRTASVKGPLPLHTRRRVIEAVLNEILGLHNKPKAAVHSVHKLTGPKKKKK